MSDKEFIWECTCTYCEGVKEALLKVVRAADKLLTDYDALQHDPVNWIRLEEALEALPPHLRGE